MNSQPYDQEKIAQYLLGSLPDAETVRLDELSFADPDFAETLGVVERELVDAFVRGELSGQKLEQFKSFYLSSPLRSEKVLFAEVFRDFTARLGKKLAVPDAEGLLTTKPVSAQFSGLKLWVNPRVLWQWSLAAAALVLVVAGVWLALENRRLRDRIYRAEATGAELQQRQQELQKELVAQRPADLKSQQEFPHTDAQSAKQAEVPEHPVQSLSPSHPNPAIASFVLAPQLRGAQQIAVIPIPPKTEYVGVRLNLEPNDYRSYRVALVDQASKETLWRSRLLTAKKTGEMKMLNIVFSAALLKPHDYILRVSGLGGTFDIVGDYPFRVAK